MNKSDKELYEACETAFITLLSMPATREGDIAIAQLQEALKNYNA